MNHKQNSHSLTDMVCIDLNSIGKLLDDYLVQNPKQPAAAMAARCLLSQYEHYLADLDSFISDKIGDLHILIPEYNNFCFDRVRATDPKFIDVKLTPRS